MADVKTTDKGLSVRSEEVQEIMGPMPHWILRWGIMLVSIILIGMGVGCWFFHYPDLLQTECIIMPVHKPDLITAPEAGRMAVIKVKNGDSVNRGDTLGLLKTTTETIPVITPQTGIIEVDVGIIPDCDVARSQTLYQIVNKSDIPLLCLIRIPQEKEATLPKGQTITITLPEYPEKEFGHITGHISQIALMPDEKGFFTARVDLPVPLKTTTGKQINIKYAIKGTAKIMLKDRRLIEKILQQK